MFLYPVVVSSGRNAGTRYEASNQSGFIVKQIEDDKSLGEMGFEVDSISLEQIVTSFCVHRVDGVKIDVEGHDLEVLEAIQGVIERSMPSILIEFHSLDLLAKGCAFLLRRNYRWHPET